MMKVIVIVLLFLIPAVCHGYDFDLQGYDREGNYIYGELDVDQNGASGYIYNGEGESKKINLEWTEKGYLEGYDEDGNYYDLELEY